MRAPARAAPQPNSSPTKRGKAATANPTTSPSNTKSKAVKNVPFSRDDVSIKASQGKASRGRSSKESSSCSPRRRSTSSGNSSRGRSSSFSNRPNDDLFPPSSTPTKGNKRSPSKGKKPSSPTPKKSPKSKGSSSSPTRKKSPAKKKPKSSPPSKSPKKRDSTPKGTIIKTEADSDDEYSAEDELPLKSSIKQEQLDTSQYREHVAQSIETVINMSIERVSAHLKAATKETPVKAAKKPKASPISAKKSPALVQERSRKPNIKEERCLTSENESKKDSIPHKKRGRPKGSKNKKKETADVKKNVKKTSQKKNDKSKSRNSSLKPPSERSLQTNESPKIAAGIDSTKTPFKNDDEDSISSIAMTPKKKYSRAALEKTPKKKASVVSSKVKSSPVVKKPTKPLSSLPVKKRIKAKKEDEEEKYPSKPSTKSAKVKFDKYLDDTEDEKSTKKSKKESSDSDGKKFSKTPPKSLKKKTFTAASSSTFHSYLSEDEEEDNEKSRQQPLKKVIKSKWTKEINKHSLENKKKSALKKTDLSSPPPKKRKVAFTPERRSSPKYYAEDIDLSDSEEEAYSKRFKGSPNKRKPKKKETPKFTPSIRRTGRRIASLNAEAFISFMSEDAKIPLPSFTTAQPKDHSMALVVKESTIARAHSDDSSSDSEGAPMLRGTLRSHRGAVKVEVEEEDNEDDKILKKNNQKRKRRKGELDVQMDMRDMVVKKRLASLNASAIMAASYSMESRSRKVPPASSSAESEVTNIKRKISYKSTKDQANKTRSVITVQETTKKVKKAQGSSQTEVEERIIVKKRVKRQRDLEVAEDTREDGNATDTSEIDQEMLPKSPETGMIVESTITYVTTHTHTVPKTVSVSEASNCTISSTNENTTVMQQVQRKSISSSSVGPVTLPHSSHLQQGQVAHGDSLVPHPTPYSPLNALSVMQPVIQTHTPPSHSLPYPQSHHHHPPPPPPPHHHLPHQMPHTHPYSHISGQPPPFHNMPNHHHFHSMPHPPPPLTPAYPLTPHSPPYPPPRSSSAGSSPACSSSPSSTPRPLSSPSPHPSLASSGYGTSPNECGSKGSATSPPIYGPMPPQQQQQHRAMPPSSGKHPEERAFAPQMSPPKSQASHPPQGVIIPQPPLAPGERHHSAFTTPTPSAAASSHCYQPVSGPIPTTGGGGGPNASPNYKPQLSPSISQPPYSSPSRMNSPPPPPPPAANKGGPVPPAKPEQYSLPPHNAPPQPFQSYSYSGPYEKYYPPPQPPRGHPYNVYQHNYHTGGYSSQGSPEYSYPHHPPPPPPGNHGTGTPYSQDSYNSRNLSVPPPARPPSYGSPQASPPHHQALALPPPPSSGGSPHHHSSLSNANYPFGDYGVLMYPSTGTIIRINFIGPKPHHPPPPPPPPGPQAGICCPSNSKNLQRGPLTGTSKGSEKEGEPGSNADVPSTQSGNYHYFGGCQPSSVNVHPYQPPQPQHAGAHQGPSSYSSVPPQSHWQDGNKMLQDHGGRGPPQDVIPPPSSYSQSPAAPFQKSLHTPSMPLDNKKNVKLKDISDKGKDAKESLDNIACTNKLAKNTHNISSPQPEPKAPVSSSTARNNSNSRMPAAPPQLQQSSSISKSIQSSCVPASKNADSGGAVPALSKGSSSSHAAKEEPVKTQAVGSLPSPVCSLLPSSTSVSVSTIGVIPKKIPNLGSSVSSFSSNSISISSSEKANLISNSSKMPSKTLNIDCKSSSSESANSPSLASSQAVPIECASKSVTITSSKNSCRKNDKSATTSSSSSSSSSGRQVITTSSASAGAAVSVPNFPTLPINLRTPQTTWVVQPSASLSNAPSIPQQGSINRLNSSVQSKDISITAAISPNISKTSTTTLLNSSGMHSTVTSNSLTKEKALAQPKPETSFTPPPKDLTKHSQVNFKEKSKIEAKIETLKKKAGPLKNMEESRSNPRHLMCHCVPQVKNSEVVPKLKSGSAKNGFSSLENMVMGGSLPQMESPPKTDSYSQLHCDESDRDKKESEFNLHHPRKRGRPPKTKDVEEINGENSSKKAAPLSINKQAAEMNGQSTSIQNAPNKPPSPTRAELKSQGHPNVKCSKAPLDKEPLSTSSKGATIKAEMSSKKVLSQQNMKAIDINEKEESKPLKEKDTCMVSDSVPKTSKNIVKHSSTDAEIRPVPKNQTLPSLQSADSTKNEATSTLKPAECKESNSKLNNNPSQFFRDPPEEVSSKTSSQGKTCSTTDESTTTFTPITNNGTPPSSGELKVLNIKTEIPDKIKIEKISPKQNSTSSGNLPLTELKKLNLLNGDSDLSFKDLLISTTDKLGVQEANSALLEKFLKDEDAALGLYEKKAGLLFTDKWQSEKMSPPIYQQESFPKFETPKSRSSKSPPQNPRIPKIYKGEKKKKYKGIKAHRTASLLASLKDRNNERELSSLDLETQQSFPVSGERKKCKKKDDLKKKRNPFNFIVAPRRRRSSGQLKGKINKKPKYIHGWSWDGDSFDGKVWLRNDEPNSPRKCYKAMKHKEGDRIKVRDCVLLKSGPRKTDLPYVAKVAALWEDPETSDMMMSILWYYRPEHTDAGRRDEDLVDEIFASKHKDHLSVACIEDRCYVLTFNEYCRYQRLLRLFQEGPNTSSSPSPVPDAEDGYARKERQPSGCVVPESLFFCRKVYDYRQKRILKNPPC